MIRLLYTALLLTLGVMATTGCTSTSEPMSNAEEQRSVLLVLTNTGIMGDTDKPTGFFLSEAAHPWAVFDEAGYNVTLASPKGGEAPIDPRSLSNIDDKGQAFLDAFAADSSGRRVVPDTLSMSKLRSEEFDAVFFAGGHGTMWDFEEDPVVSDFASKIYTQGGVVAAVCHGPAALVNVRVHDTWLLDGKRATGFTNAEEEAVELTDEMPFLLQTRMTERGATFIAGENFQANVISDERLVTGQNPASATGTAEAVVELLE